jgi:hypothetical protein
MRGLRFDVQEYRTSHIMLRVMQDVIRSLAVLVTQPVRLELRWSARVAPHKKNSRRLLKQSVQQGRSE